MMLLKYMFGRYGYMDEAGDDGAASGGSGDGSDADAGKGDGDGDGGQQASGDDDGGQKASADGDGDADKKKGDAADDGDDDGAGSDKGKSYMVPKSRLDSVSKRFKKSQDRIEELEKQLGEKSPAAKSEQSDDGSRDWNTEFADLDTRHADALADGDRNALKQVLGEQRALQLEYQKEILSTTSQNVSEVTRDQIKYDSTLEVLETDFPAINPDSEDFDQDIHDEMADLSETFQNSGRSMSASLERAASYVLGSVQGQEQVQKRTTNVDKNVDASKRQAPSDKGGLDNGKAGIKGQVNVMKMSQDEFDRLGDEELSRLRGDNLPH